MSDPEDPYDITDYLCHGTPRVSLAELLRVADARWAIEETFQTAKGEAGLDHDQVRHCAGW